MSFWSWLKAGDKTVDIAGGLLKDASSGIDMMFYTDEEKSQANQKILDTQIKFAEITKGENSLRSMARRELAKMIIRTELFFLIASAGVWKFDAEYSTFLLSLAKTLSGATMAVVIFYFGYYGVQSVVKATKKKS